MIMGVLFLLTLATAVWAVRSRSHARAAAVPSHLLWAGLALLVTRLSAEAAGGCPRSARARPHCERSAS